MKHSSAPVVVYCDGSAPSLEAALWAIDEASSRRTWLRLVAVVQPDEAPFEDQLDAARRILRSAASIVRATSDRVLVKSELLVGDPLLALLAESQRAAVICLGIPRDTDSSSLWYQVVGLSAAPVALVGHRRTDRDRSDDDRWVVAVLRDVEKAESVWRTALREARLRGAAVMALVPPGRPTEEAVAELNRFCASDDLEIWLMPGPVDVAGLLSQAPELEHTVIIGVDSIDVIDGILGSPERSRLVAAGCSIVVVPRPELCPPTDRVAALRHRTLAGSSESR